jgi:sigma-B regulation protein RsbU (phosphoserine phosphatase)
MRPQSRRILVVDDDPAMLRTVERILAPGHEVQGFPSGDQAMAAFEKQPFDVAIVDVRMPGMDGFELTHAIKSASPRTEVILVTGSVTDLDDKLVRSVKERAGYFITKPFSRAVLTSLVDRALEIQRLEEERDSLIERLTEDLGRARRYQQALQPKGLPRSFGPIRVASAYLSSESVGGDLFDVVPRREDRLLLMVADVVGHGVAAALVTGMVKTAIGRALQDEEDLVRAAGAVIETLAPLGPQRFVTMFLGMVDAHRQTLEYVNAGHPPALLWSRDREPRSLDATTPLLSFGLGLALKPARTVPFRRGDRLALYTDGLYEVRDPGGSEFGRDRLAHTLVDFRGSIEETVAAAMEATRRHAGGRPPDDDLTLVVAEFGSAG